MNCGSANYPSQYKSEVILRDGSRLRLRPIHQDDVKAWLDFVSRLGPHTKILRFHHVPGEMDVEDALHFCTVDYKDTFALVAEMLRKSHWDMVAIGRYYRLPRSHTAEFALVVEDVYQGKGIGTKMLECLINAARDNNITKFECEILAENNEMMAVLRDYGFHITSKLEAGVYHVTFPIVRDGSR
jgi:RimJ/RimL family protein N-acetyltransferase